MYHCNWHLLIRGFDALKTRLTEAPVLVYQMLTNILLWRQIPVVMAWEQSYPNATIGSYIHWLLPVVHHQDQKRITPSRNL